MGGYGIKWIEWWTIVGAVLSGLGLIAACFAVWRANSAATAAKAAKIAAQQRSAEDLLGVLREKSRKLREAIEDHNWTIASYVADELLSRMGEFRTRYIGLRGEEEQEEFDIVSDRISVVCWLLGTKPIGEPEGVAESEITHLRAETQDIVWRLSGLLGQVQAQINGRGG